MPTTEAAPGPLAACHAAHQQTILGATALCEQGSEIVQLFVELVHSGVRASDIRRTIHIHPTLAEAAKNAILPAMR